MVVGGLRAAVVSAVVAPLFAVGGALPVVAADPGVLVYPGMEIHQGTTRCTLGYVDVQARTGYTAGHCRGNGAVTDKDGRTIGNMITFRDNTPDGATIATDHQISDWETITLAGDVMVNNILPGGRVLVTDPAVNPQPGEAVCHFGVVTGETCGNVDAVNNGWFTMSNGIVSQKGDSGGPVYTITPDNRAVLVGVFNSTWGRFPAAVSWSTTDQQTNDAVVQQTAGR
ncbi:MAG: hypothetical protein P4L86_04575 [Mycobacterium sp.]|nr:hypothetical protein [Mycobacterium sp.]